jgi:hypothetical protein
MTTTRLPCNISTPRINTTPYTISGDWGQGENWRGRSGQISNYKGYNLGLKTIDWRYLTLKYLINSKATVNIGQDFYPIFSVTLSDTHTITNSPREIRTLSPWRTDVYRLVNQIKQNRLLVSDWKESVTQKLQMYLPRAGQFGYHEAARSVFEASENGSEFLPTEQSQAKSLFIHDL